MLFTTAVQAAKRKARTHRANYSAADWRQLGGLEPPRYFQPLPVHRR